MATIPTFTGDGSPILSLTCLTGNQCMKYVLFWGDYSSLMVMTVILALLTAICQLKGRKHMRTLGWNSATWWACLGLINAPYWCPQVDHLKVWLRLNRLINQLSGQMGNYSMPQKLPGTMIQMIPIQFSQHLGYKKVWFTLSGFRWQLIFLSGQVGQCSHPIHASTGT